LAGVVSSSGTGASAALATFTLAAKTGTARRVVKGHYAPGEYTASFAALFPAEHPQLVVVVKIDNPRKGSYFAAETAAPVTRAMLEQALASRTVALDRARLSAAAPAAGAGELEEDPGVAPFVVSWPPAADTAAPAPPRPIPDVAGRTLRDAVRLLHRRGFHVVIKGWGNVEKTWPPAGVQANAGTLVTVFGDTPQ
ncbi:MAG TPA: penicillin-binding transpeptidase domain-containing protein, partial [Gemmatimonadales bacterium]|nr:penicillin-binding transpeptidase domain-containing protein [Gemmatimonadales bacterium]